MQERWGDALRKLFESKIIIYDYDTYHITWTTFIYQTILLL